MNILFTEPLVSVTHYYTSLIEIKEGDIVKVLRKNHTVEKEITKKNKSNEHLLLYVDDIGEGSTFISDVLYVAPNCLRGIFHVQNIEDCTVHVHTNLKTRNRLKEMGAKIVEFPGGVTPVNEEEGTILVDDFELNGTHYLQIPIKAAKDFGLI